MPRCHGGFPPPEGMQLKTLPPIEAPQGAIAEANQRRASVSILPPRGIQPRIRASTPTAYTTPHDQSSMWFKELYAGYLSAQFCGYATNATDPLKLIASETTELSAAASKGMAADDSLPPRPVGIWILANNSEKSTSSDLYLDALSTWATFRVSNAPVANHVRMTALFGIDAVFFMDQTKHEQTSNEPLRLGVVRILVRWNDGAQIKSAWRDVPEERAVVGSTGIMRHLQDTVVLLCGCYDIPLPPVCNRPVQDTVLTQAFYFNLRSVSIEFFNMLEGTPSITKSKQVTKCNDPHALKTTGVLVRVVDKRMGQDGIKDPSCFHGALLGIASKHPDVGAFVSQTDDYGLRLPIAKEEVDLGLHLCAVQAEGLQLGKLVSLFGTLGIAGKPIHSPNSWVWVARPAIRPVDATLLEIFSLHPCDKQSLIPGKAELVSAFERFWSQTTRIYKLMGAGEPPMKMSDSTDSIDSVDTIRVPSPKGVGDERLSKDDLFMLAALQVDMKSERTTIGDAYAHVASVAGSNAITDNMKQAMADLGVRASLYDMFVHNQKALVTAREADGAKRQHAEILLSLCDVALEMAPGAKRARTRNPQEPLCLSAERMRRILKACGLKGGEHLTLERGREVSASVLQNMIAASSNSDAPSDSPIAFLMKRPYAKLKDDAQSDVEWLPLVEQAIAMSAATAMVATRSLTARLFLVVGTGKAEEILIKTVELNGTIYGGTMDDMCRVKEPRVIILQKLDDKRVRLTATLPIA